MIFLVSCHALIKALKPTSLISMIRKTKPKAMYFKIFIPIRLCYKTQIYKQKPIYTLRLLFFLYKVLALTTPFLHKTIELTEPEHDSKIPLIILLT